MQERYESTAQIIPDTCKNEKKQARRRFLSQGFAVLGKNLLMLSYGMTNGYPTILIPKLKELSESNSLFLTEDEVSWTGSIIFLGIAVGSLFSGIATQPLGRRRSMQFAHIPLVAGWITFVFCNEVWHIFLALSIFGLAGGLMEAPVLVYVGEISESHLRGFFASTSSFSTLIGVVIQFGLGSFLHWRTVAIVSVVPHVLSFIVLFFVPESPHWYIMKNRMDEARQSLARLRGWVEVSEVEQEFQTFLNPSDTNNSNSKKEFKIMVKPYKKRRFLEPLAMISFMFLLLHFTGMSTLQVYSVLLFHTFRSPINSYDATTLLAVAQFIGCVLCMSLIKQVGKRVLMLSALLITAVCFTAVATYAYLEDMQYMAENTLTKTGNDGWLPFLALELAAIAVSGGTRIVAWIYVGETFSRETRSIASGMCGSIAYLLQFLANKTFLDMSTSLTLPGTYWFHGAFGILGLIILYFWMPETEGKDLNDISDHFAGKTNIGKKVKRKPAASVYNTKAETPIKKIPETIIVHDMEKK